MRWDIESVHIADARKLKKSADPCKLPESTQEEGTGLRCKNFFTSEVNIK